MAEYEWCGRVTFDRIRVMCPNHPGRVRLADRIRVNLGRVTWQSPNKLPNHPGRVRMSCRIIPDESDWLTESE